MIDKFVARQKVNVLVLERISNLLLAGEPRLVQQVGERWVWRVPVDLTFPSHGRVGCVGELDVDARYGRVCYADALLAQMADQARRLAEQVLHLDQRSGQAAGSIGGLVGRVAGCLGRV